MNTNTEDIKAAEKATTEAFRIHALKTAEVANALALLIRQANEQKNLLDGTPELILLKKAELREIERDVDNLIRNHDVYCSCGCGEHQKLRTLTFLGNDGMKFIFGDCKNPILDWGTPLTGQELAYVKKILKYASVRVQDLFDKVAL